MIGIQEAVKELKHPGNLLMRINYRYPQFFKWMSDEQCLRFWYRLKMGEKLNLNEPKLFNEKLQWLKLNYRHSEMIDMVDKYKVKKYVSNIIGKEYIIPTLGIWDFFDDIDFSILPDQFVLKCTHDSGGLVICKDKNKFDIDTARKKINRGLSRNFYWVGREWPYKNVKPRIIAEKYMEDKYYDTPRDYKFHNFNGEPRFILVCSERFSQVGVCEDFFDTNWQHMSVGRKGHPNSEKMLKKPECLGEMLYLSKLLAKEFPFIRTDFYEIEGKVYFGEITFFPTSGFEPFVPELYDRIFGEWIKIDIK